MRRLAPLISKFALFESRLDHADERFCRGERVLRAAEGKSPSSAGQADMASKKSVSSTLVQRDAEFTIQDGGSYFGYEEMAYAAPTGAVSRDNLLQ